MAGAKAVVPQGSPPPPPPRNTENRMGANGEKGDRVMTARGGEEGPATAAAEAAALQCEDDGNRVGPAAAAALAATAIRPIPKAPIRAGVERSGGTGGGGAGAAATAASNVGATGEKAVHPSPAEETAGVSKKTDGGAPAVGWEVAVGAAARRSPPLSSGAGKPKLAASPGEANSGGCVVKGQRWDSRSKPAVATAAATTTTATADPTAERKGKQGLAAVAEAWCGAEASSLKRDAQQAKKRSWDEFDTDSSGNCRGVVVAGVRSAPGVVSSSSSSKNTSGNAVPKTEAAPKAGSGWQARDKSSLPPSAAATGSGSTAAATTTTMTTTAPSVATAVCRPTGAPEIMPVPDDEKRKVVVDTPEVAAARAALKKAEALVGVDLPSLDKGPPDAEADCILCHVPRGAFLRAEKGTKGFGWCHCLCAFSKGLLIENRVVKVREAFER